MGTGKACTSCGAHIEEGQSFCTSCGATVAVAEPAVAAGAAGAASASKGLPWLLVAAVGGVAAAALIGGGIFLASSGGDEGPASVGAVAVPLPADKSSASAVTAEPTITVTATATATETQVAPPQAPTETVYIPPPQTYVPPQSTTPSFSGSWTGNPQGDTSYAVQMSLSQSSSDWVSGTISSTRADDGTTASWNLSGPVYGNQVELTPDSWISQPNSTWRRDTVTITKNGSTLTATFVDPREPGQAWGTTSLR